MNIIKKVNILSSGVKIEVICKIKEYSEYIEYLAKSNKTLLNINNKKEIRIVIDYNNTIIECEGERNTIFGFLNKTDIYYIIYNIIQNNLSKNELLIHSTVISNNNITILVIGNFYSGKTELSKIFQQHGFKIISTDQTSILIDDNKNYLTGITTISKTRNGKYIEENLKYNKKISINLILQLSSFNTEGKNILELTNKNHKIKNMFKYITWSADIPLFTDNTILEVDRLKILRLLKNIDLPFYNVSGNYEDIYIQTMKIIND